MTDRWDTIWLVIGIAMASAPAGMLLALAAMGG